MFLKEKRDIVLRWIPIILAVVIIGLTSIFNEYYDYPTVRIAVSVLLAVMILVNGVRDINNNKSTSGRVGIIIGILIIIEAVYKFFLLMN